MRWSTHRRTDDPVQGRVLALVSRQRRDGRHEPAPRLLAHRHQHLRVLSGPAERLSAWHNHMAGPAIICGRRPHALS